MNSLVTTRRTGRHGHDQNKRRLQRDIEMGLLEFKPIVETIRLRNLVKNMTGKLILDFMKFRDIVAHKGVENIIFCQMVVAFVMYCKGILKLQPVTHEPASTTAMNKTFARMADINVVICAEWFLHELLTGRDSRQKIVRRMTIQVQNSSFSHFTFSVAEHSEEILITYGLETLQNTSFNTEWLEELATLVQNSSVTYSCDEENELRQFYQTAVELM